jgi:hypothetical protein
MGAQGAQQPKNGGFSARAVSVVGALLGGFFSDWLMNSPRTQVCQGGCGGCFFAVLFISSVDVMQNCEGSLSRDKFLF